MKILEFIIAATLLTLMPGPDILYVLSQSIIGGARKGITITAGLCSGLIVYSVLVSLGIGAAIAANQTIFNIIKVCGAIYLLYLAVLSLLELRKSKKVCDSGILDEKLEKNIDIYKKGIIMNLLNPKITVFFLSIFPPFITDSSNVAIYSLILSIIFIAIVFTIFSIVSLSAGFLSKKLMKIDGSSPTVSIVKAIIYLAIASFIFVE